MPTITNAETNYLAFDIISNDYHIELYGWLQEKTDNNSVKECDHYIKDHSLYDVSQHKKEHSGIGRTTYQTLPTYIRNRIHHPSTTNDFTNDELRISTLLLISLCRELL